ncbi:hypothetical protein BAC2_03579 [uncultured bacterium]|nr:hypothetical protein BAC2_03579 [uncultured bacterium]
MAQHPNETQARLTQIAMAVKPEGYIADEVLPRVTVNKEAFKYRVFDIDEQFTPLDTHIGRSSAANEVEFSSELVDGSTRDWGLDDFIPQKDLDDAADDPTLDLYGQAVENTTNLVVLARESRAAGIVFNANSYDAAMQAQLSGTSQWSHADSDPVKAIRTAIYSMLLKPTIAVFGSKTWLHLSANPKLVAAIINTGGRGAGGTAAAGVATEEAVAAFFGLKKVLVGDVFANSAKKGQASSLGKVWGAHAALLHINPQVANAQSPMPTWGFTAALKGNGRSVRTWYDPKRGINGGQTVRVAEQINELITFKRLGYFFQDAVSLS